MAYCKNCGNEVSDQVVVCPHCGVQIKPLVQESNRSTDTGGFGWGLLGFCIPIVGLVLFLAWKDSKPNSAKSAGIGALIGFVLGVFTSLLMQ